MLDRWWTEQPINRRYFDVVLESGQNVVVFHDDEHGRWFPSEGLRLRHAMTLLWFFIWFTWNLVGDNEPITFDPVNFWAGFLLLAMAIDLAGGHAHGR